MKELLRYRQRPLAVALIVGLLMLGLNGSLWSDAQAQETADVAAAADTTPPFIPILADIVAPAADANGATVSYLLPAATDDIDGPVVPVCAPVSGALFPIGVTPITCTASDIAGNQISVIAVNIIVADLQGPFIEQPGNVALVASDATGMAVTYAVPGTSDNVSGPVPVSCSPGSGTWFPIGSTIVTCSAADASGNVSAVSFTVTLEAPAIPTAEPTVVETETAVPTETPEGEATETPDGDDPAESTATPSATAPETETATPSPTSSPTASPAPVTTPAAMPLPASPPPPVNPIYGSGPIDGLALIWGGLSFPVSQEYGHTAFSLAQETLYLYGIDLGLDGRAHPGLDIGMPAGTYLYSPVDGTVIISGGVPAYTYYGNGEPGVGELLIETDAGDHVILGHMAAISVHAGQRVSTGDFVGLSGGENGDHLHLETRAGGFTAVDPRQSFLIAAITAYNTPNGETADDAAGDTATDDDEAVAVTGDPAGDADVTEEPLTLLDELQYIPNSPFGDAKKELIGEFLESRSVTANDSSSSG